MAALQGPYTGFKAWGIDTVNTPPVGAIPSAPTVYLMVQISGSFPLGEKPNHAPPTFTVMVGCSMKSIPDACTHVFPIGLPTWYPVVTNGKASFLFPSTP